MCCRNVEELYKALPKSMREQYTKITKDLSWAPVELITSKKSNTVLNAMEYLNVPTLNQYQEIKVYVTVGDNAFSTTINKAFSNREDFVNYSSANYNGELGVYADFDNNRIGIATFAMTGWTFANMYISRVLGTKLV